MTEDDAIHFSRLKLMGRSPAHYQAYEQLETASLRAGRALHAMVLGGDPVIQFPGKVRRGREWDAFEAEHAGSIILSASEMDRTLGMAEAVKSNPHAMELIGRPGVLFEQLLSWTRAGRSCAGRVDILQPNQMAAELKSTKDAKPDRFAADALRRAYAAQLAWYIDGSVEAFGSPAPTEAYIISVESAPPYPVVVWRLTPRMLEMGTRIFSAWYEQLCVCIDSNEWPGYALRVLEMDAPDQDWGDEFTSDEEEAA